MSETWKPVIGYEEFYSVSNIGRVRRDAPGGSNTVIGRILKHAIVRKGYHCVTMSSHGTIARKQVSHLVAAAFIGPRPSGLLINHKNGVKSDNRVENLEYVTEQENNIHAVRTGLRVAKGRSLHGNAKLSESDVSIILSLKGVELQRNIASRFGITQSQVSRLHSGEAWGERGRSRKPRKRLATNPLS